jgi:hypothetical protein
MGVKTSSTRRFSLRVRPRLRAKFEPDRSSRLKVHMGEMAGFLYVRVYWAALSSAAWEESKVGVGCGRANRL